MDRPGRRAVAAIVAGELDKVVLARDLVVATTAPVDLRRPLRRLAERYPSCWTFAVDGLRRRDAGAAGPAGEAALVTSRVLAGTVAPLGDDAADGCGGDALLGSTKDLEEHEFARALGRRRARPALPRSTCRSSRSCCGCAT